MFAVRGAIGIDRNDRESILTGSRRLLEEIMSCNDLEPGRIVAAHFTMTPDLDAAYPASAARELGWIGVPMLGAQETPVPGAPVRMLRVLLLVRGPGVARHVYLGEAEQLRPDLVSAVPGRARPDGSDVSGSVDGAARKRPADDADVHGSLLVVGLGLVGGSVALGLREVGLFRRVLGTDVLEAAVRSAKRIGAVEVGSTDPAALLAEADVVLLAIPVDAIPPWLARWSPELRPATVLLDVGSTKTAVVRAMDGLPEEVEAVGGHPLGGTERSGVANARADMFQGRPWALVETIRTGSRARSVAESVVAALGAHSVWVGAAVHDRQVAATSHLPYLVSLRLAFHLAKAGGSAAGSLLHGPASADMTRLARSSSRTMAGIVATNWPRVREELLEFEVGLRDLRLRLDGAASFPEIGLLERVERVGRELEREPRREESPAGGEA
ncbi:MAG: chorismate mutase [Candidatus Palauibacterales bacterium]|nr:chorismate mutase [Candidatus Palauibacterales bacterium]